MRMADQFQGQVVKDSLQALQLRSLYNMANMQFVIPDSLIQGEYGVIPIPEDEKGEFDQDALVLTINANGQSREVRVLGGKGGANFTDKISLGNLDFSLKYGSKVLELPFGVQLNDFIAEKYPGTENAYASFMSKVTVKDERPFDYDIYMNHVLDHKGYRFFQSGFDPDEKGTKLSVNHDLWGTWITYIGYFLLYLGLMGIMFFGKTRFKDLSKALEKLEKRKKKIAATAMVVALSVGPMAAQEQHSQDDGHDHQQAPTKAQIDSLIHASIVDQEHADAFGKLVIQDEGGRMKPINTFASELLRKLSLKDTYMGYDADQVFLSMMMNPAVWYNAEVIALDKKEQNDSIRKIVGVPMGKKYVKATDFFDEKGKYKLEPYLRAATATNNPNKFEQDFKDANIRLNLLNQALGQQILKIFPLLNDENNKWISAVEYRGGRYPVADSLYSNFIKNAVPYYLMTLGKAQQSGDYTEADKLLAAFKQNQENHGAEVLPSETKINTEVVYNQLDIFNRLYQYYAW